MRADEACATLATSLARDYLIVVVFMLSRRRSALSALNVQGSSWLSSDLLSKMSQIAMHDSLVIGATVLL